MEHTSENPENSKTGCGDEKCPPDFEKDSVEDLLLYEYELDDDLLSGLQIEDPTKNHPENKSETPTRKKTNKGPVNKQLNGKRALSKIDLYKKPVVKLKLAEKQSRVARSMSDLSVMDKMQSGKKIPPQS